MNRYLLTIVFTLGVMGLYHFVNIQVFNLDLSKKTKEALFVLRDESIMDTSILILNIGKLEPLNLKAKIDTILKAKPRIVGINLCHFVNTPKDFTKQFVSDERVIIANCSDKGAETLCRIIDEGNIVTHFKSDRNDYFEFKLSESYDRGNEQELVNYKTGKYKFYREELNEIDSWNRPELIKNKTILLGYLGDYLTDNIYDYKNCRITPLNEFFYSEDGMLPDMYDTEITANIISTINQKDFINEVNRITRVFALLLISIINVIILTYSRTKWTIVNVSIATILFILLTGASSFLIVYLFTKGYYLALDELPFILIITTVFTVILNIRDKRAGAQQYV